MRELDADWLLFRGLLSHPFANSAKGWGTRLFHGCGRFLPGLLFGFLSLEGFGFFKEDSAEAGGFFLRDVFGVGVLPGRRDE
jgi:hypothetical protein